MRWEGASVSWDRLCQLTKELLKALTDVGSRRPESAPEPFRIWSRTHDVAVEPSSPEASSSSGESEDESEDEAITSDVTTEDKDEEETAAAKEGEFSRTRAERPLWQQCPNTDQEDVGGMGSGP